MGIKEDIIYTNCKNMEIKNKYKFKQKSMNRKYSQSYKAKDK